MNLPKSDRRFFTGLGIWCFLVTFIGFSPTFYLRSEEKGPLPSYIVLHGVLASLWVLFFLLQAGLISGKQRKLHAALGLIGIPLALAVAATGAVVALRSIAHRNNPIWGVGMSLNNVLGLLLFVLLGVLSRRRPEAHKRYMVLAIVPFLGPAAARWDHAGWIPVWGTPVMTFAPMVALFVHDYLSRKSIHQVTAVGFPCVIAWHVATVFVVRIPAVEDLVRRLAAMVS